MNINTTTMVIIPAAILIIVGIVAGIHMLIQKKKEQKDSSKRDTHDLDQPIHNHTDDTQSESGEKHSTLKPPFPVGHALPDPLPIGQLPIPTYVKRHAAIMDAQQKGLVRGYEYEEEEEAI